MMRRWIAFGSVACALGVSLSAAFVGGCSSASNPYPDQYTFCEAKAQSECNSPLSTTGGIAAICNTSSTCVAARQAACIADANSALAGGLRTYSPTGATACIAAVQQAYAATGAAWSVPYSAASGQPSLQVLDAACEQGTFPGTVAAMGVCKNSNDCSTDASGNPMICSPIIPGSSVTQCATAIPVAQGGECANFGSQCAAGTFCLGSKTTAPTCQAGAGVGSTCTAARGCASGGYCSITGTQTEGSCLAVANQAGVACTSDIACGGGGPVGSTPTTSAPYCDPNVHPTAGTGTSACEAGQGFSAGGSGDCNAFGGSS